MLGEIGYRDDSHNLFSSGVGKFSLFWLGQTNHVKYDRLYLRVIRARMLASPLWSYGQTFKSGGKDLVSSGRLHFESERARRKVEAAALSLPHFSRAPRIRKWRPKARTKEAGHP